MLELHAFGPVDLRADSDDLGAVLTQPKRLALLLYLVLARPQRLQRRDTLLALFWPELDEAHARKALSQSLSFLRRGLPESILRGRGQEEVGVEPAAIRCDVQKFEEALDEKRWEDAVELYRGELLAGFHVADAPGFQSWLDAERERLRELAAGAAWSLAHRRIEAGALVLAERAGQRALRLVPTDESAARDFIGALAAAGDRAAALRFYDKFAAILAEELEVDPAPETAAVEKAIRTGSIGPGAGARGDEVAASATPGGDGSAGDAPAAPPEAERTPAVGGEQLAPAPGARWAGWPALAAAGVLLAVAGIVQFMILGRKPPAVASRVAVLPFENRTGEAAFDELGVVAADWISAGLARIDKLQGVSTPTILGLLAEPGVAADRPRLISSRTGAGLVVTGYVVSVGDSLEFHSELVDPLSGEILNGFDPGRAPRSEPTRALAPMRQQIMGIVALRLDTRMAGMPTVTRAQPPSYPVYRAYVTGVELGFDGRYAEAVRQLNHAWAADSSFMAAGLWLASGYWMLGRPARVDSILRWLHARRASLSRGEQEYLDLLDAQLRGDNVTVYRLARDGYQRIPSPEGRYMTGSYALQTNRLREAVRTLQAEPENGPMRRWLNYHLQLTGALHTLGEYQQELQAAREACTRFPDQPEPMFWQARALIGLGRVDEALALLDQSLTLPASNWNLGDRLREAARELRAHGYFGPSQQLLRRALEWYEANGAKGDHRYGVALALQSLGQPDSAATLLQQLTSEQPESLDLHGSLALALVAAGRAEEARRVDRRLIAWQEPYLRGQDLYWRAAIAAQLGEERRALGLLQAAVAHGVSYASLYEDEALQPLRDFPDFRRFMEPPAD